MPDELSIGPCCCCETTEGVVNLLMLSRKCPTPGRGWGCFTCGLPQDGAQAALCSRCLVRVEVEGLEAVLRFACRGWPGADGRIPVSELTGLHEHDLRKHPEVSRR